MMEQLDSRGWKNKFANMSNGLMLRFSIWFASLFNRRRAQDENTSTSSLEITQEEYIERQILNRIISKDKFYYSTESESQEDEKLQRDDSNVNSFISSSEQKRLIGTERIELAISFKEEIYARYNGKGQSKGEVKFEGTLMISFEGEALRKLTRQPTLTPLTFRLLNTCELKNIVTNPRLIILDPSPCSIETFEYHFDMAAINHALSKQCEETPDIFSITMDILKYNIQPKAEARSIPLKFVPHWICQPCYSDLAVHYECNSSALIPASSLKNIEISIPVDKNTISVISEPKISWIRGDNVAICRIEEMSAQSTNLGRGLLFARFFLECGPSTPKPIAAEFICEGTTLSGVEIEINSNGYSLSTVRKHVSCEQYVWLCDEIEDVPEKYGEGKVCDSEMNSSELDHSFGESTDTKTKSPIKRECQVDCVENYDDMYPQVRDGGDSYLELGTNPQIIGEHGMIQDEMINFYSKRWPWQNQRRIDNKELDKHGLIHVTSLKTWVNEDEDVETEWKYIGVNLAHDHSLGDTGLEGSSSDESFPSNKEIHFCQSKTDDHMKCANEFLEKGMEPSGNLNKFHEKSKPLNNDCTHPEEGRKLKGFKRISKWWKKKQGKGKDNPLDEIQTNGIMMDRKKKKGLSSYFGFKKAAKINAMDNSNKRV